MAAQTVSVRSSPLAKPRVFRVDSKGIAELCQLIRFGADFHALSFKDLAHGADCTPWTASRYYRGAVRKPSLRCAVNLLRASGYSVSIAWTGGTR